VLDRFIVVTVKLFWRKRHAHYINVSERFMSPVHASYVLEFRREEGQATWDHRPPTFGGNRSVMRRGRICKRWKVYIFLSRPRLRLIIWAGGIRGAI
jgi:hypothetical protein